MPTDCPVTFSQKNIQTEKIIFRDVYEYTYAYMYIITIKRGYGFEKEKGIQEVYRRAWRKERG